MSGVQTLSSQNFVLFELFKFFTFLLGFWYGKKWGQNSNTNFYYFYFWGEEWGVE